MAPRSWRGDACGDWPQLQCEWLDDFEAFMSSPPPPLPSLAEFLFNISLYDKYALDIQAIMAIYYSGDINIDGHCPFCHKQATFAFEAVGMHANITDLKERNGIEEISIKCAR